MEEREAGEVAKWWRPTGGEEGGGGREPSVGERGGMVPGYA